jgi:hypothetical protein
MPAKRAEPFGFALIFFVPFLYQDKKGNNKLKEAVKKISAFSFIVLFCLPKKEPKKEPDKARLTGRAGITPLPIAIGIGRFPD